MGTLAAALVLSASRDSVAMRALAEAAALTGDSQIEYAGAIFECGGQFQYTPPAKSSAYEFKLHIKIPGGCKFAALYHTHPKLRGMTDGSCFSPLDTYIAQEFKVASYIVAIENSEVRVYAPGMTPDADCQRGRLVRPLEAAR